MLDLTWDYATEGELAEPSAERCCAEINGRDADGQPLSGYSQLRDDGSTACGCWIYCGCFADGDQPHGQAHARQRAELDRRAMGAGRGRRTAAILYNRASADPQGRPWSERKALVWWDDETRGMARPRHPRLRGRQAARLPARRTAPTGPRRSPATSRSSCRPTDAAGCSRPPASPTGRCRPTTSRRTRRCATRCTASSATPARQVYEHEHNRYHPDPDEPGAEVYPVRRHHLPADRALHRRRHVALDAVPGRAAARVLLRGLTGARRRARPRARRLGDARSAPAAPSRRA